MKACRNAKTRPNPQLRMAWTFILLMGIVSLFSDMTHESAKSLHGVYLLLVGADAATIGFIAGLGELIAYAFRLVSGILTDRTGKYWIFTIAGYMLDLLVIPALALVPEGGWQFACALLLAQRMGKAIKKPAKDTLLSFAATQSGVGKSFAVHELMDQIGAVLGPLLMSLVLFLSRERTPFKRYALCYALLLIPAAVTLTLLFFARSRFPHPEDFEGDTKSASFSLRPGKAFFFFMIAISLFAFGFLDFSLLTMHAAKTKFFLDEQLPLLYAGAMAADALSALIFGWLYDRRGIRVLMISTAIAALFPIFIFAFSSPLVLVFGVLLWGVGMGAQESIMKAAVTTLVPKEKRSGAYGIFYMVFGIFCFAGSWAGGALYDISLPLVPVISSAAQLLSIPFFYGCWKAHPDHAVSH